MGSEATHTVGLDNPLPFPLGIQSYYTLAQIPDACNMEDLLRLDESESAGHISPDPQFAGHISPDPQSAGDTIIAGLRQAVLYAGGGLAGPMAVAENLAEQNNAHPWLGRPVTGPGLVAGNAGPLTGTGMAEIPHSWCPLSGFNMREINDVLNPTAPVKDTLSAENPPPEATSQVLNAGHAIPEPDPYSTGHTSCCTSTTTAAGKGSRSLDQDQEAISGARELLGSVPLDPIHAPDRYCSSFHSPRSDLERPPPPGPLTAQTPSLLYGFPAFLEPLPPKPAGAGDEGGRELPEMETKEEWSCGGAVPRRGSRRRGPRAPARKKNSAPSPSFDAELPYERSDAKISAEAGLTQSGGSALTEAPVRESCKRKKVGCSSSSQKSSPEFNSVELSDPTYTDTKPPDGSTPIEIVQFLKGGEGNKDTYDTKILLDDTYGTKVNRILGEQDQICPKAVRSYVTTVQMMADQKPHDHLGCWKEKQVESVEDESLSRLGWVRCYAGLKKTFQFQTYDGTKTNWFMDEYIATNFWGFDLYMESLRFRVVYKSAEVPGEPTTSPQVKSKNKIAALKHRKRKPENLIIKGESPAWQHLIKVYDRHPELEGSKVVYAVCCHCGGVLKAGTENGTKSLLTHCNRTCPIMNKNQQPSRI